MYRVVLLLVQLKKEMLASETQTSLNVEKCQEESLQDEVFR